MCRVALAVLAAFLAASPALAAEPVVAVWYRGTPAGTPNQNELAVIRALGFNGVTWPESQTQGTEALKTMAAVVGLRVTIADAPRGLDAVSALAPPDRVDIVVTAGHAEALTPLAWRAVAHGARTIAFDSGAAQGAGLEEKDGSLKPWARAAISLARQLTANARLTDIMKPGPGVIVAPAPGPGLDVVLLDGDRSWVLVATNISIDPISATVRLPAGAPYAIWISWLDGSPLAMVGEAAGPRWMLQMEANAARVYLIDKIMK